MSLSCEICGLKFRDSYNLDRHNNSERHKKNEMGVSTSRCGCGRFFKHKSSYSRHKKICEFSDDFECTLPTKTPNDYSNLSLILENEKLKMELKHQNEINKKEIELNNQIKNNQLVSLKAEFQENIIEQQKELINEYKSLPYYTINNTMNNPINNNMNNTMNNIGNKEPKKELTKKEHMNLYFHDTLDFETFIENFKSKYPLTKKESEVLVENYRSSGAKSYAPGLYFYLKNNYRRQVKDLTGEEPDEDFVLPFVSSDSSQRTHLEKIGNEWELVSNLDKIQKIIIISNDYIYSHHTVCLPITIDERSSIASSMLRKSCFSNAKKVSKKQLKNKKKNNLLEK